ncbi:MAG: hypothetical protein WC548_01150 [Candidatus Pacearchaeota archaeon]
MLTKIEYKKRWFLNEQKKRVNKRRRYRLDALQYSRQLSDKHVAEYIGMNEAYWSEFKKEFGHLDGRYEKKLIELFGQEVIWIFMDYYIDKMDEPVMKWADEL